MASKKTESRVVKKTGPKTAKRGTVKKSARKTKSYNPQTGKLTGRAIGAQQRLDTLAERYQSEGMSAEDARQRARDEMRNNPRRDWRHG
jgi:hypothetical protein